MGVAHDGVGIGHVPITDGAMERLIAGATNDVIHFNGADRRLVHSTTRHVAV